MLEFDDDLALRAKFARFGEDVRAAAPRQDFARVRTIARRQRTTRVVVMGIVAALVLAVPMAAFAIAGQGTHHPPVNPPPSPRVDPATPSPSANASPTQPAVPRTTITPEQLLAAGVTLPPWTPSRAANCIRKVTNFSESGPGNLGLQLYMNQPVDVDGDGNVDLVAWFMCFGTVGQSGSAGSGGDSQVVAFTRDATGAIVVLGQVVTTFDGPIKSVSRIGVSGTDVSVEVGDWFCCESGGVSVQRQTRTYRWDGHRFNQSGGPRSFPANPKLPRLADLSVTASDLVFSTPVNGQRTGTLQLKVTNRGPDPVDGVKFTMGMNSFLVRDPAGNLNHGPWSSHCTVANPAGPPPPSGVDSLTCTFSGVTGGATATYNVTFNAPASAVSTGVEPVHVDGTAPGVVVDSHLADNRAYFNIITS